VPGRLVRIDIDATSIATNAVPDVAVVSDAAAALRALLEGLPGAPSDGTGNGHERAARWRVRIRAEAQAEGRPWLEIVDALAAALGRDAVLAGDSAMACYYGALSNLPLHRPGSFLYPAASAPWATDCRQRSAPSSPGPRPTCWRCWVTEG
jgi:acetolactate synthase-1/2/3 large subunit